MQTKPKTREPPKLKSLLDLYLIEFLVKECLFTAVRSFEATRMLKLIRCI